MSSSIMAMVTVELKNRLDRKQTKKLKKILEGFDLFSLRFYSNCSIEYTIWGNSNSVDYSSFDRIKEFLHDEKIESFTITADEYQKNGDGLFYDSDEEHTTELDTINAFEQQLEQSGSVGDQRDFPYDNEQ